MCGFAGFIDFKNHQKNKEPERLQILKQMGEQLSRRGPDDEQYYDSMNLSFVFRRLSIVDLAEGKQPIWNEDQTVFVAVNGEIYNHIELRSHLREKHHFRTHSDAEIFLHLYEEIGLKALHLLNGMFAIALWDVRKQQLFLARDRLGIKPLYYAQVGSQLIFGSTLNSLLAHPDAPRHPQFQDLTNLSVTTSYVRGVNRLAGGHYLLYDANTTNLTPQCYWNLENYLVTEPNSDSRQPQDYIREYSELFVDSVKKRLMSDVPVGAFLSGGLDSGAIVAVANQFHERLHCFSILADYTRNAGDAQQARQFCERLNLPFHPLFFDSEKLLDQIHFSLETFEYFIWLMDMPKFCLEWLFKHELYRYAKTVCSDLKVMLLGQGADEFAAGYSNPEDSFTTDWQGYIQALTEEEQQISQAQELTSLNDGSYLFDKTLKSYPAGCTAFQKYMLREVYYLQDFNLWHEDRNSMVQSIEARVPFLDHHLVEYLAAIPPQHHAALFWNKTIVREMAGQWLPHDFTYRKKSFGTSHHLWSLMQYRIVQRIFPQFREKYLANCGTLFSEEKILDWFNQANVSSPNGIQVLDKLFNAMAMTVFKNLCLTGKAPIPLDYLYGCSPLKTLHDF
jgi:asparagine synthase (glutamine-hydrolysing)